MPAARSDASTPISRKISRLTESRDLWKTKYRMLMTRCRVLENQVRAVEASRNQWRQKFRDSQDLKKS
ncbi:hypothetical protein [Allorhodopirellula solitaria]|uniref:Uncharacterized protein n=1 Tax=Allorhodopirellula solitaria TaxID=2527987 RepID=A0A5C5X249_9BACT|nr:hypothetical protein [Allorhodopirellula solitaria]TWT56331.1 hypothetical protein CA85_43340 [Allorhodopirellula solitaria]